MIKSLKLSQLNALRCGRAPKNAGGKNEGKFHYVVENTCRKNVGLWAFHDVDENKRVIGAFP
jgi:hypothetical protein